MTAGEAGGGGGITDVTRRGDEKKAHTHNCVAEGL